MPIRLENIEPYRIPLILDDPRRPYIPKPVEPITRNNELDPFGEEFWDDEIEQSLPIWNDRTLLPITRKVVAQTIGLDLVAVRPMSSPRTELLFVDFTYVSNVRVPSGGNVKTIIDWKKKEEDYNRDYSDIDPYGEEDWSN